MASSSHPATPRATNDPTGRKAGWSVFAIAFVVAGAAIAFQLYLARGTALQAEKRRLEDVSRYTGQNLVRQLHGLDAALGGVRQNYEASLLTASTASDARQLALLSAAMPSVSGLSVLDANGVLVASDKPDFVGQSLYTADYFVQPRAEPGNPSLYLTHQGAGGDAFELNASRAMLGAGQRFEGVVTAHLASEFFAFTIRSALFAPDMRATLLAPNGDVLLTIPPSTLGRTINVAKDTGFGSHVKGRSASTFFEGRVEATGLQRLVLFTTIDPPELKLRAPIILSVSRSREAVYAAWQQQALSYSAMYFAVLALAGFIQMRDRRRRQAYRNATRETQRQLALALTRLDRAVDGAQLGLWELDLRAQEMRVDARGAQMLGMGAEAVSQSVADWNRVLHPADSDENVARFKAHIAGQTAAYENEFRVRRSADAWTWLYSRGKSIREAGDTDRPSRIIGTFMDITDRKRSEEALAGATLELQRMNATLLKLSYKDALTGLGNRRMFDERLASEWSLATRDGGSSLSMLMIDVDYFKKYNDHQGHQMGDECLQAIAQALSGSLRQGHEDAYRYGGEEFVVLLPNTGLDGAEHAGRRLIETIAALKLPHGASPIGEWVTISIGAASVVAGTPGATAAKLTKAADEALYRAKAEGRARLAS